MCVLDLSSISIQGAEGAPALLPCPFCGTVEGLYPGYLTVRRGLSIIPASKPYQIDCVGCGIEFEPREDMDVFAAWNRRTDPIRDELLKALKYARRFVKAEDVDVAFIDAAIAKAEGRAIASTAGDR